VVTVRTRQRTGHRNTVWNELVMRDRASKQMGELVAVRKKGKEVNDIWWPT